MRPFPELLTVFGGPPRDFPIVGGQQDDVAVDQDSRAGIRLDGDGGRSRFGLPERLSVPAVQAHKFVSVMKDNAFSIRRQGARGDRSVCLPEQLAGIGGVSEDLARIPVPAPVGVGSPRVVPDIGRNTPPIGQAGGGVVGHQEGDSVRHHDLARVLTALAGQYRLAGGCVQDRYRRVDAQRHVHVIAHGNQAAQQVGRAALERILTRIPLVDLTLPEDRPVEGVTGNQTPTGGELNGRPGALVQDVKETSFGRNQGRHAGHVIVVAGPARAADPLQPFRRGHNRVLSDGVSVRSVQIVSPLVHPFGPGFDRLLPLSLLTHQQHAARRQDSQQFALGSTSGVFRDDQVD